MSSPLPSLGAWARGLKTSDVPADVLRLARLQIGATTGAIRAAAATPAGAALVAGRPLTDAGLLAGLGAIYSWDDYLLAGRTGVGAVPAALGSSSGHTVADLVLATVIGNEIGGRIGLSLLLGPRHSRADTHATAAAAAAALAWLDGRDGEGIARAVAGAVERGERLAPADVSASPEALGTGPMRAARDALANGGRLDLLDEGSDFWSGLTDEPVHGAFGGLGSAWLTRTLVIKPHATAPWAGVGVEAVDEILRRHVKAADKRLRAEQVEKIELRVGFLPWAAHEAAAALGGGSPVANTWSLARAVAILIARHSLTPADLTEEALAEKATEIEHIASRVEVVHDWALTLGTVEGVTRPLGPLLSGRSPAELRQVRTRLKEAGGWPRWHADDLWPILQARPDRILRALRAPAGDLGGIDLETFRWHLPVQVKLYTTRGGWWPERRALPRGSSVAGDLESIALSRHGKDAALLTAEGDASSWARELLS